MSASKRHKAGSYPATALRWGKSARHPQAIVVRRRRLVLELLESRRLLDSTVVFNEIMYRHRPLTPQQAGQPPLDSPEQWIELYNNGTATVDLTGWQIEGGSTYAFAAGTTIAPGAYLVVSNDVAALQAEYPTIRIVGNLSGKLSHTDDVVELVDAAGNPDDFIHYYDSASWPAAADGGGSSLELRDPHADNPSAEAWAASDESGVSGWQTYSYSGVAQASAVGPDGFSQEFDLGLFDAGELLLDNISVLQDNANGTKTQLIRNGNFESGTNYWQFLGDHSQSQVIVDPSNPANHILELVATDAENSLADHVVNDGVSPAVPGLHALQVIMTSADVAKWPLHSWIDSVQGEVDQGCTVVSDGTPYYDVAVRLKGSPVGRIDAGARGFHITFHSDDLFRGSLSSIGSDRSGQFHRRCGLRTLVRKNAT